MNLLGLVGQAAPGGSPWSLGIMYLLIFGIFIVIVVLPQRRKQKAHEKMLSELQAGERVITSGGLVGTIARADKDALRLRLAPSVEVTVLRGYVVGKAPEGVQ